MMILVQVLVLVLVLVQVDTPVLMFGDVLFIF